MLCNSGFPRHHRVLHVRQEIKGGSNSVLNTVLEADVERNGLLEEEKEILKRLNEEAGDGNALKRAQELAKKKVKGEQETEEVRG